MAQTDIALSATNLNIPIIIKKFHNDFIIEEVFFTGIKTAEGKNYNSGRYFKLTNNTKEVLYADKLIIGQSEFLTTEDKNPTPYNVNLSFPVKAVMVLPVPVMNTLYNREILLLLQTMPSIIKHRPALHMIFIMPILNILRTIRH
jgi:hypothetical protein